MNVHMQQFAMLNYRGVGNLDDNLMYSHIELLQCFIHAHNMHISNVMCMRKTQNNVRDWKMQPPPSQNSCICTTP